MNKDKFLKWLDDEISMYEKRIEERKGPNYHDESERILRFEERLGEAIRIKEHIQSEPEEKTNFDMITESPEKLAGYLWRLTGYKPECNKTNFLNWLNEKAGE